MRCLRCKQRIKRDGQVCLYRGQYLPCVGPDDPNLFRAGSLVIRAGDRYGKRVEIPEDPYKE